MHLDNSKVLAHDFLACLSQSGISLAIPPIDRFRIVFAHFLMNQHLQIIDWLIEIPICSAIRDLSLGLVHEGDQVCVLR